MVGLIFADNAASVRLFERLGFARWGSLPVLPAQITSSAISLLWAGITTRTGPAP